MESRLTDLGSFGIEKMGFPIHLALEEEYIYIYIYQTTATIVYEHQAAEQQLLPFRLAYGDSLTHIQRDNNRMQSQTQVNGIFDKQYVNALSL